jgi:hypothetical protein
LKGEKNMKSIQYILCLFITLSIIHVDITLPRENQKSVRQKSPRLSQREKQEQRQQESSAEEPDPKRQKTEDSEEEPIVERAESWVKNAWSSVKSSLTKAKHSIQQNTANKLSNSKKHVNKKWNTANQHHRNGSRRKNKAQKSHHEIHHHFIKAQAIMEEVEDSDDYQLKKHAQRYNRSARKSNKDAESVQSDLEFALRHVAQESERIEQINAENLEMVRLHQQMLLEYQANVAAATNKKQSDIKKEERALRKKQRKERRAREKAKKLEEKRLQKKEKQSVK